MGHRRHFGWGSSCSLVVYGVLQSDVQHRLSNFISTSVMQSIAEPNSELHKALGKLIISTVQGTVGASTKQFFELSLNKSVNYVPIYIPRDHDIVIFVDFIQVPSSTMPEKVVFSLEALSQEIPTSEPRSLAPLKILQRVRQQREEAVTTEAFAGPKKLVGILGRIAPNVFTAQFQLRPTDLDKRIFVKLIVLVINPIWVENEPSN